MFIFFLKTIIIVIVAILIRGTMPRYRIDQLISLNWKLYIYIYILFLLVIISSIYFLV